jgi:hypothetical protein
MARAIHATDLKKLADFPYFFLSRDHARQVFHYRRERGTERNPARTEGLEERG